ncbi:MAG: hypothetical protein DIU64_007390, partial [Caldicoprobacter oshimai]
DISITVMREESQADEPGEADEPREVDEPGEGDEPIQQDEIIQTGWRVDLRIILVVGLIIFIIGATLLWRGRKYIQQ